MSFEVIVLPRARRDVQQIYDWLSERSPDGAARWFNAFGKAIEALESAPESCGLAPENDFVELEIRERIFKTRRGRPYRALFAIVGQEVRVLHVRAPGQDFVDPDDLDLS